MYRNGLLAGLLVYVYVFNTGGTLAVNSLNETKTTFDHLQFWQRDPKYHGKSGIKRSRKFYVDAFKDEAKRDMHKFLHELHKNKSVMRFTDIEKLRSELTNDYKRSNEQPDRRRDLGTIRFRKVGEESETSENKQKLSKKDDSFHPLSIIMGDIAEMHAALLNRDITDGKKTGTDMDEKKTGEKGNQDKSALSPYSLHMEINDIIIPHFEQEKVNITVEVLGRTVEYNDILLLKVTHMVNDEQNFRASDEDKYDDSKPDKKIIFIVHGLSVMGFNSLPCLRSIGGLMKLMSFYFKHLENFDIFIIPMANPDGVSVAGMRAYWNKNISPQMACPGVALDRNFDVGWNQSIGNNNSCSQQYPGPNPFSEPETLAIRTILHKFSHRIIAYFHVHAATYTTEVFKGDAVLYPKGFTDANSEDDKYIDLRGEIDEVMKNASFRVYSINVDTLYNWYGKVVGTSVDYASSVYGIPFAMELVMQLYDDDMMVDNTEERETQSVLNEVWGRVINVIFEFIHKYMDKPVETK